jgi:hypothetical protein
MAGSLAIASTTVLQTEAKSDNLARGGFGLPSAVKDFTSSSLPKQLVFTGSVQTVFDRLMYQSFPGARSKEQCGTVVYNRKTGEISVQNLGGLGTTSSTATVNFKLKDPTQYSVLGSFHTHPYDRTENSRINSAASSADMANFLNRPYAVAVIQSGKEQTMLVRTSQTPTSVDSNELRINSDAAYDRYRAAGVGFSDACRYAMLEMATLYKFAVYSGAYGRFIRQYPAQSD